MKIIFDPNHSKSNQYVIIITKYLNFNGFKTYSVSETFASLKKFKEIELAHLNWYENLSGSNGFALLFSFIKKMTKLILLRMANKKIVWTMHNKIPHDQKMFFFKKILLRYMIKHSNRIVVHCHSSYDIISPYGVGEKVRYIPHPDYIDSYGPRKNATDSSESNGLLNLLFLGAVKPYKNIELLLDVMKSFEGDVVLTIAGKPSDSAYKTFLTEYAADMSNVKLELKFIQDDQIPAYMRNCDLLILPYDLKSSLNSGTVILAFSYGRTVICPEIGTISDFPDNKNILSYDYQDRDQHLNQLREKIKQAISMKKVNPDIFNTLGEELFQSVKENNSKNLVSEKLLDLYKELQ